MTTRLAIILGLVIAGFFALDLTFGWGWTLFLSRRFVDLVDWVIFWR